jgi:hypothetical protein
MSQQLLRDEEELGLKRNPLDVCVRKTEAIYKRTR